MKENITRVGGKDLGDVIYAVRKDDTGALTDSDGNEIAEGKYVALQADEDGFLRVVTKDEDIPAYSQTELSLAEISSLLRRLVLGFEMMLDTELTDPAN